MKKNISILRDCYGCGVCTAICPVNIISLKQNVDGFYSPIIDDDSKCIECGLCLKTCAFNHKDVLDRNSNEYYAGYSKNPVIRQRCSSGGIGFEIGRHLINKGYKACGVRYNVNLERAEHFIADNVDSYAPSIGSKYIPSFSEIAFKAIDTKEKYLVTGTPCQIDSLRRYIRHFKAEDRFILMDFFCHGVPSILLWTTYLHTVEDKIGKAKFVAWRNKTNGWHDSWNINIDPANAEDIDWHNSYNINILEKKHFYQSRWKEGDLFYKFFLGNYCLNKCCYKSCKFKLTASSADIRIGDLWGKTYLRDKEGLTAVIAFTNRGKTLLDELSDCKFTPISEEVCIEGQMTQNPSFPIIYNRVIKALNKGHSLSYVYKRIIKPYRFFRVPKRIINFMCYRLGKKAIFH